MELLKMLAEIRNPVLDALVGGITYLGDETFFMVVGLIAFWCVSKKWGYRFMIIGLTGTSFNQLLKAIFLIPRPWVLDPTFTIVESAREAASGYSFPSGHTQSAACVFGTLAAWIGKRWMTILCIVMVLLVGFSRMYLGVHTPLDVGVSLLTGAVTVLGFVWLFNRAEGNRKRKIMIGLFALICILILLAYVSFAPVTERNIAEFDAHGVESAWKLLGSLLGMLLAWIVDEYHTHFETKAVWWAQVLKMVIGAALVVGIKASLKPVLVALLGDNGVAHAIRYFLMAFAGAAIWPMSFRFFARLGQKNAVSKET